MLQYNIYSEVSFQICGGARQYEVVGKIGGDRASFVDFDLGLAGFVSRSVAKLVLFGDLSDRHWRLYGSFHDSRFYVFHFNEWGAGGFVYPGI